MLSFNLSILAVLYVGPVPPLAVAWLPASGAMFGSVCQLGTGFKVSIRSCKISRTWCLGSNQVSWLWDRLSRSSSSRSLVIRTAVWLSTNSVTLLFASSYRRSKVFNVGQVSALSAAFILLIYVVKADLLTVCVRLAASAMVSVANILYNMAARCDACVGYTAQRGDGKLFKSTYI